MYFMYSIAQRSTRDGVGIPVNEAGHATRPVAGEVAGFDAGDASEQWAEYDLSSDEDFVINRNVLGVELITLGDAFHAYELLLHMLQHFLL